jgi:hypothetical protein
VLLPAVYLRRRGIALERMRAHWKTGALSGVLAVGAYGIAVWAMTRAPIARGGAPPDQVVVAAIVRALFLRALWKAPRARVHRRGDRNPAPSPFELKGEPRGRRRTLRPRRLP